jgi:hypothetical protein
VLTRDKRIRSGTLDVNDVMKKSSGDSYMKLIEDIKIKPSDEKDLHNKVWVPQFMNMIAWILVYGVTPFCGMTSDTNSPIARSCPWLRVPPLGEGKIYSVYDPQTFERTYRFQRKPHSSSPLVELCAPRHSSDASVLCRDGAGAISSATSRHSCDWQR